MTDPFAVSDFTLSDLPATTDRQRNSAFCTRGINGEPGFADVWLAHIAKRPVAPSISAVDFAARVIRDAYEDKRHGFLDMSLTGEPGQKVIVGTPETIARSMVIPDRGLADLQSKRLALVTLIDHLALHGKPLTSDLRKSLVIALQAESRFRRRQQATLLAGIEGRVLASGGKVSAAVREGMERLNLSQATAYELRRSPTYRVRCDEAVAYWSDLRRPSVLVPSQYATDAWFAGTEVSERLDHANRVAQHIINLVRERTSPSMAGKRARLARNDLRWDVLNLFQGADRLRSPPTEIMRVALDYVLGLVDARGQTVPIALAGVSDRDTFMKMARLDASWTTRATNVQLREAFAQEYSVRLDKGRFAERRRSALYQTAVEQLRMHRFRSL